MKVRRIGIIILAAILLAGCAISSNNMNNTDSQEEAISPEEQEKILYENGMNIINTMVEMAGSDIYISLIGFSGENKIQEIIDEVAQGSYSQPKSVYQIKFTDSVVDNFAYYLLGEEFTDYDKISDTIKEQIEKKAVNSFATMINAAQGTNVLAASSVIQAGECFVCKGMGEKRAYLYLFEKGYPVVVSYSPGKDGAVSANGVFLFDDISLEDLEKYLGYGVDNMEIEIKEIKIN